MFVSKFSLLKTASAAGVFALALSGQASAQGWGSGDWDGLAADQTAVLGTNDSAFSTAVNSNKQSWSDNPKLTYNAWGMTGGWLTFRLTGTANAVIKATADGSLEAPAFTLYKTTEQFWAGDTVGAQGGQNGAVHSFSAVAQAGQNGLIWATAPNASSAGVVETLAYANSGNAHAANAFGQAVNAGFNDVSIDHNYDKSLSGSVGLGYAEIDASSLTAGYYTIFVGGADHNLNGGAINLSIITSAVPEPSALLMFGSAFIGMLGAARRKLSA